MLSAMNDKSDKKSGPTPMARGVIAGSGTICRRSKDMLTLPSNPNLKDFQKYVARLERGRGFDAQDILQKCLLLGEAVGELYKAIRKSKTDLRVDTKSNNHMIEEELADILIYLCAIANKYDIDFERAFRDKEEINKQRTWG